MKRRHRTEQKTRAGRTAFREVTALTLLALTLISTPAIFLVLTTLRKTLP